MGWRMGFVLGAAAAVVAEAGALVVVLGGLFDVRASMPHSAPVAWATQQTFRNHVHRQALAETAPARFSEAQVLAGFRDYDATCVSCHGGPGVSRGEWVEGLTPTPPYLLDAAQRWSPAELKVIIADGVKMTAMPAWRFRRTDGQLWDLVAFLEALPGFSPADYQRLRTSVRAATPAAAGQAPPFPSSP